MGNQPDATSKINIYGIREHGRSKWLGWLGFGLTTYSQTKCNVTLQFSAISVYLMAIPYCDKAHAGCGMCAQLSSHFESEITSLVPQASSSLHHLQYIMSATESWSGAWEQDYSFRLPEKSSCMKILLEVHMQPTAIAFNYSITNIWSDVCQIYIFIIYPPIVFSIEQHD